MTATLTFCGGTGTVTGANFLLDTGKGKLLVDCGSFQGEGDERDVNRAPFPYDPASIEYLLVTHAHQDHIGRIPRLVRQGFRGTIISTAATRDLAALMFDDALGIMQTRAERGGGEPLYDADDVARALAQWQTHDYHERFPVFDAQAEFFDAGHILGSALIKLTRRLDAQERSIVFTGDIGNSPEPLLHDTESADPGAGPHYVVMESVYGDRVHEGREGRKEVLRAAVERARAEGGVLLVPSFSIERTQVLLYELNEMVEEGGMQPLPMYLDSPLAERVTDVFRKYHELFNKVAEGRVREGDDLFSFPGLSVVQTTHESAALHHAKRPFVILAGAGMSSGGRIRAHEIRFLPDPSTTLLFVGYQVPGSLGRRIEDGAKEVEIEGQRVRVRAHITRLGGYSGHADREGLLDFVEHEGADIEQVFVVMGEPSSASYLAQRIRDFLGIKATTPQEGERVSLDW